MHGEGRYYINEVENKHLKSNLSPGLLILSIWLNVSRNYDVLTKNGKAVFQKAGMQDPSQQESSMFKFSKNANVSEIYQGIWIIRKSIWPCTIAQRTYGELLHPDLVKFLFLELPQLSELFKWARNSQYIFLLQRMEKRQSAT